MNDPRDTRAGAILGRAFAALFVSAMLAGSAHGATCVWNSASGDWLVPGNWAGCADAPGPSTRSPGPTDIAVVVDGTCNLGSSPTVAELELGSNGHIHTPGSTRTLTIAQALRLNGGRTTTVLGVSQLHLILAAGASGSLLASSSLDDATYLMNSGSLALGSATGTSLTLKGYAQLQNLAGGSVTMAGGNSRLYLELGAEVINAVGATFAINGNAQIGKPVAAASQVSIRNFGSMSMTGPGALTIPGGGVNRHVQFKQFGELVISNATLHCDMAGGICLLSDIDGGGTTPAVTRLANSTLDLGGPAAGFPLSTGATLTGNGTINGRLVFGNGLLAPGALSGTPYGTLAFTGNAQITAGRLDLDLGGGTPGSHDVLQIGGTFGLGDIGSSDGRGHLILRLAAGYTPGFGAAVPVVTYASVDDHAGFNLIDANYTLDFATRFDATALNVFPAPRLTVENASRIEGNAGSGPMTFNVRLSQPSSATVTVAQLRTRPGTAANGLPPSGDFLVPLQSFTFAPGETLKQFDATIHGDLMVEGDEEFALELDRNGKLANAAYGNGLRGRRAAIGTIVSDDLPAGTRMLLVGTDNTTSHIRRYTTGGLFIDSWKTDVQPLPLNGYTGMCFTRDGNVLATRFFANGPGPSLFSRHGARLAESFANTQGFFFHSHESCVHDRAGNVYVGQGGGPIHKFNPSGVLLESFVVPTGARGTDWIELAGDQCTMYYTSEDTTIRRYNVCTRTVLPILTTTLIGPWCYALRLRPNRELMVACTNGVHRLDRQGAIVQTYTRESLGETDANGLFAINLDPDGTSFWTAGATSGKVYRVSIASGAVLTTISGIQGAIGGLAVYDELGDDMLFADGFDPAPAPPPEVGSTTPCAALLTDAQDALPQFVPEWLGAVLAASPDCLGDLEP